MQYLNSIYTQAFNLRHKTDGALLRGRFFSKPVYNVPQAIQLFRYIHLNPVAAGMVESPADYPWTSFAHYAQTKRLPWIDSKLFSSLFDSMQVSPKAFERWLMKPMEIHVPHADSIQTGCSAEDSLEKHLNWPIACPVECKPSISTEILVVIQKAAMQHHVSAQELLQPGNLSSAVKQARSAALLACLDELGASYREIGEVFNLARNSIGPLIHRARARNAPPMPFPSLNLM